MTRDKIEELETLRSASLPAIPAVQIAKGPLEINTDDQLVPFVETDEVRVQPVYADMGLAAASRTLFVRDVVSRQLVRASSHLPEGFRLVLYDAWRSEALQLEIYGTLAEVAKQTGDFAFDLDDCIDRDFPQEEPPHRTEGVVDVSLVGPTGLIWPMGSGFDEPTSRSVTKFYELEKYTPASLGRSALFHAMNSAGFTNYPCEW